MAPKAETTSLLHGGEKSRRENQALEEDAVIDGTLVGANGSPRTSYQHYVSLGGDASDSSIVNTDVASDDNINGKRSIKKKSPRRKYFVLSRDNFEDASGLFGPDNVCDSRSPLTHSCLLILGCILLGTTLFKLPAQFRSSPPPSSKTTHNDTTLQHVGPYELIERQEGVDFFDYYTFYDGEDSLGSAGYQHYVGPKNKAEDLDLIELYQEGNETLIMLKSKPTSEGMRQSLRLEGKRRFERGLFILDVRHMPVGCGVWPAFWLTDEDAWPDHGEIDILEGINYQLSAKTALHTSEDCDMYAHVPSYAKTGKWDRAQCIPDTFTGEMNCETSKEADNCWNMAPHQWANQGCVLVDQRNTTIGQPLNAQGGGVYVLEWDPANGYIKSWVFSPHDTIPTNLQQSMDTAAKEDRVIPDPSTWKNSTPYAFFAIGEATGCSADHFQNMHIIFNLAFCGTVAGNRYFTDCPATITNKFNVKQDPVLSCNAYIKSQPEEMKDAYWKIRGVYVYERQLM